MKKTKEQLAKKYQGEFDAILARMPPTPDGANREYLAMKEMQARASLPQDHARIEALFDQLDASLAELQAGLKNEPGHHCADLVETARGELSSAQQFVTRAIECDKEQGC